MPRYWVISPYESTKEELFQRAWEYDLKNGTIAIGWVKLRDVSKMSKSELRSRAEEVYSESPKGVITRICNAIWWFYHEIPPGDVFIARQGRKKIVGIGRVQRDVFYDEQMGRERIGNLQGDAYANFRKVDWTKKEITFDKIMFSMDALYEIPEEKYKQLVEGGR